MTELSEIRAIVTEQNRTLGRIEGALASLRTGLDVDRADRGLLDGRLRKVEQRQHWYAGFSAAAGGLLSVVFHGRFS